MRNNVASGENSPLSKKPPKQACIWTSPPNRLPSIFIEQREITIMEAEIAAEEQAELKLLFPKIKQWYMGDSQGMDAVRDFYGAFPTFWKDLKAWEHYKPVKKRYFAFTDGVILPPPGEQSTPVTASEEPPAPAETPKSVVEVSNFPPREREAIKTIFASFGTISDYTVEEDGDTASAYITFELEKNATSSLGMDNFDYAGSKLSVTIADPSKKKKKKKKHCWGPIATSADGAQANETSKKRRSRWGTAPEADGKRKSRWGPTDSLVTSEQPQGQSGNLVMAAAKNPVLQRLGLTKDLSKEEKQEVAILQVKIQQAQLALQPSRIATDCKRMEKDPNRPPSPPPQYDSVTGLRTNTREVRLKEQRLMERQHLIESMLKLNPLFRPPADYIRKKPEAKLYIPIKEYPTYNFIGLVIGPRGNTQKKMEQETNCKIAIRGRGSIKEGSKGKANGKYDDENDDLHVLVQGESEDDVQRAVEMVKPLLVPMDDEQNEHKQSQLRELALINGTLKDDEYCHLCGEKGHRQHECPTRFKAEAKQASLQAANIRCAICGETSHPTRDCPKSKSRGMDGTLDALPQGQARPDKAALDQEYMSFIAELDGGSKQQPSQQPAVAEAKTAAPQQSYGGMQAGGWGVPQQQQQQAYGAYYGMQQPQQGMPPAGAPGYMPPAGYPQYPPPYGGPPPPRPPGY